MMEMVLRKQFFSFETVQSQKQFSKTALDALQCSCLLRQHKTRIIYTEKNIIAKTTGLNYLRKMTMNSRCFPRYKQINQEAMEDILYKKLIFQWENKVKEEI